MANQEVTYVVRLKDMMTKAMRTMHGRARQFARFMKSKFPAALALARAGLAKFAVGLGVAAAAVTGLAYVSARIAKDFLNAASGAEDAGAKFNVVFQGVTDDAQAMAEAIGSDMGLGVATVQEAMAAVGDTIVPMGMAREEAASFSAVTTMLVRDIVSFNPRIKDMQQGLDAVTTSLVGSFRSARQFGVVLDMAGVEAEAMRLGLANSTEQIDQTDKAVATLSLLIGSLGDSMGDTNRTADSFKNSMIFLGEAIHDIKEEMGARLKIIFVDAINQFGGLSAVVTLAYLGFEFFTRVIADVFVPVLIKVGTNIVKFIDALGGTGVAVETVGTSVTLMAEATVMGFAAAFLGVMLFAKGVDTVTGGFQGFYYGIKALVQLLARTWLIIIRKAAEGLSVYYELLDSLVTFIANIALNVFGELVRAVGNTVRAIGDALIAYSSLPFVSEAFYDLGNEALAAGRKVSGFAYKMREDLKLTKTPIADLAQLVADFGDSTVSLQDKVDLALHQTAMELEMIGERFDYLFEGVPPEAQAALDMLISGGRAAGKTYEELRKTVGDAIAGMRDIELTSPEETDQAAALERVMLRYKELLDKIILAQKESALATDAMAGATADLAVSGRFADQAVDGMVDGLLAIKENIPSIEEAMQSITENTILAFGNGLTDAFVSIIDGSKSAKEAFKDFAAQLLIDIGRMIIQMLVFQAISAALGIAGFGNSMLGGGGLAKGGTITGGTGGFVPLANGGVLQGGLGRAMPMKGYATGGPIVDRPHIALIGEGDHNEAVVPLPDGRSIPVQMDGGGGANVTVEINAVDARSVDLLMRERKDTLVSIINEALSTSRTFRSSVSGA